MKRLPLFIIITLILSAGSYLKAQEVIAEDNAGNYTVEQIESLENLGDGFGQWMKTVSGGDASVTVKDATGVGSNGSVINTSGKAFVLIASDSDQTGNQVSLGREFSSGLNNGDSLTFQLSWNWADGLKGFTLYNGGWDSANTSVNIDFDKSGYYVNGDSVEAHASQDDWNTWRPEGVALSIVIIQNEQNIDYKVTAITEESHVDFSGTVEDASADRIMFYNYYQADWNTDDRGSMFLNDLKITASGTTTNNEEENVAQAFELSQNFPNPFNPATNISYTLDRQTNVRLSVYNMLGQEIQVLDQGFRAPGNYSVNFNASGLNSGMYIYQLQTSYGNITRRMMLIK